MYKLGSAENKQMRQSYQINSINNELIPQDYQRSPQMFFSPQQPIFSSPVTPKVLHSPTSRGVYLSPPQNPSNPSNPMTPTTHGPQSPGIHHTQKTHIKQVKHH